VEALLGFSLSHSPALFCSVLVTLFGATLPYLPTWLRWHCYVDLLRRSAALLTRLTPPFARRIGGFCRRFKGANCIGPLVGDLLHFWPAKQQQHGQQQLRRRQTRMLMPAVSSKPDLCKLRVQLLIYDAAQILRCESRILLSNRRNQIALSNLSRNRRKGLKLYG